MIYVFEADNMFWNSRDIRAAVREALEASRRIEKDLDVAREVTRLGVALRTIEQTMLAKYPSPKLLEAADAETLIAKLPKVGSVRLPFSLREESGVTQSGFFVSAVPFTGGAGSRASLGATAGEARAGGRCAAQSFPDQSAQGSKQKLSSRIATASGGKTGVALGNSRHVELTKALRGFLHSSEAQAPFKVNFIYKDGSAGGDVHLRKLAQRERPSVSAELNAALESCRHFELDAAIDFYVLRNADIGRREETTFADQEAIAYSRARTCLDELCGADGLHLRLFHTGLEPTAVGFYRAVIDALLLGYRLQVTPVFFEKGNDEEPWW